MALLWCKRHSVEAVKGKIIISICIFGEFHEGYGSYLLKKAFAASKFGKGFYIIL